MFGEVLARTPLVPLLKNPAQRLGFPTIEERPLWQGVPQGFREEILGEAQAQLAAGDPALSATQFLAFCREGNRAVYEGPYFQRRRRLLCAVLAECLTDQGRYLDAVIDGIWCICEESYWGISAHNGSDHPGSSPAIKRSLPDVENPYIDLFAAQTGALLVYASHLLGPRLDEVSPLLGRRIARETRLRIIEPFFHRDDFHWMGLTQKDLGNWTPWILSNLLTVLLGQESDPLRLSEGITRAFAILDRYVDALPPDGGCDEGVGYWNMAGASLLDCLQQLSKATGGALSFFQEEKIRQIGRFPLNAHIGGPWFWNFADCDAQPPLDGERVFTYGRCTGDGELAGFGAWLAGEQGCLPRDTPEMRRVLYKLFTPIPQAFEPDHEGRRVCLPDLQVWAGQAGGLYAALKGGHNGEHHNHNDVGSFVLFLDGAPEVVDAGNLVYTAKTFGPDRYTLFNTRSANHNLPLIRGHEQTPGRSSAAREVTFAPDGVSMELAGAYPRKAGLRSFQRTLALQAGQVTLRDGIALEEAGPVTWVFLLRHPPALGSGLARTPSLSLAFDPDLQPALAEMPITDRRMAGSFPGSLWRLTLTAAPAAAFTQSFVFQRRDRG